MAEGNAPLVLVTGASGFVANHCVKQLLEKGEYRVRGTVRSLKNEDLCQSLKGLVSNAKYPLELVEADLLKEETWKNAVQDCTYVLHVASPFILHNPKHEDELIKPAVDGTLNVLKACKEVGGVRRVVLTSSMAAIYIGNMKKVLDEGDWSDLKKAGPYEKSKILAEKAAWDFVAELPDDNKFELATINPGLIIGPLLVNKECASFQAIRQLLMRQSPVVPDLCMAMVDVRDVAEAHIKAITLPEAAGNRHLMSAAEHSYSFVLLAHCLAKEFNSKGFNVPTRKAPKPMLWLYSWFNKELRASYPYIGLQWKIDNNRMRNVLGIEGRKIEEAVIEMAQSMIDLEMVKKPEKTADEAQCSKQTTEDPSKESTTEVKEKPSGDEAGAEVSVPVDDKKGEENSKEGDGEQREEMEQKEEAEKESTETESGEQKGNTEGKEEEADKQAESAPVDDGEPEKPKEEKAAEPAD